MKKYLGPAVGALILIGIAIWIVFFVINNKERDNVFSAKKSSTETGAILEKDLDRFYPSSVREVVRLYLRINKACYSESMTEADFGYVLKKMRQLFDDELLSVNPYDTQKMAYYDEVTAFKNAKKSMTLYKVQKQSDAVKWTAEDGTEYSSIIGYFMSSTPNGFEYTYEKFLLRLEKDTGKWKILGWEATTPVDIGD